MPNLAYSDPADAVLVANGYVRASRGFFLGINGTLNGFEEKTVHFAKGVSTPAGIQALASRRFLTSYVKGFVALKRKRQTNLLGFDLPDMPEISAFSAKFELPFFFFKRLDHAGLHVEVSRPILITVSPAATGRCDLLIVGTTPEIDINSQTVGGCTHCEGIVKTASNSGVACYVVCRNRPPIFV